MNHLSNFEMKAKETSHGFKKELNPIFSKSQYYNNYKKRNFCRHRNVFFELHCKCLQANNR
jgi:hypothetical protein